MSTQEQRERVRCNSISPETGSVRSVVTLHCKRVVYGIDAGTAGSLQRAGLAWNNFFVDGGPVAQGNHNPAADLCPDSLVNLSTPDVIKSELTHFQELDSSFSL